MSRGQQGIGISAAGMYGLLTTGKSVHIISLQPQKPAHYLEIQMDTARNRADVIKDEEIPDIAWERGTEVVIELVATYAKGRQSVDEYVEQTAIANPHALIHYRAPTGEHREFPRGATELPAETCEIKPHPHGIELGVLMKMLKDARPDRKGERTPSLSGFLQREFSRVTPRVAAAICEHAGQSPKARPAQIGTHDVERLYQAMQAVKIMAPPTNCLAPIGVRNLLAGLLKEVKAEFYTATTRDPAVYRGNPFQIEIALAYGGSLPADQPARVIRFANRVPLLYQQSACAAFKSVLDVDWRNYGLSQPGNSLPVGPLVVMVHMASVWVPFTSESKEAIADYDEIRKEMKLALQECGRKLAAYLRRRRRQRMEADRRSIFGRYIPDVAEALANLTGLSEDRLVKQLSTIAKMRWPRPTYNWTKTAGPSPRRPPAEPRLRAEAAGPASRRRQETEPRAQRGQSPAAKQSRHGTRPGSPRRPGRHRRTLRRPLDGHRPRKPGPHHPGRPIRRSRQRQRKRPQQHQTPQSPPPLNSCTLGAKRAGLTQRATRLPSRSPLLYEHPYTVSVFSARSSSTNETGRHTCGCSRVVAHRYYCQRSRMDYQSTGR